MTLLLPNSVFLHIPKTGGTWARKALIDAGLSVANTIRSRTREESYNGTLDSWHNVPEWDIRYRERLNRFCFVRHPADWYRSYWAFRMWRKNWNIVENDFDYWCSAGNFEEFIEKVLHNCSGYLTQMYAYFTDHCTFVGKSENLPTDLLTALDLFKEKYDPRDIVLLSPIKVTPIKYKVAAIYAEGQLDRILEAESGALERYDYT